MAKEERHIHINAMCDARVVIPYIRHHCGEFLFIRHRGAFAEDPLDGPDTSTGCVTTGCVTIACRTIVELNDKRRKKRPVLEELCAVHVFHPAE